MLFISTIINYAGKTATQVIEKIKNGDKQLKEKFIEDYIPFILKVVSSFYTSKMVDLKSSDEYSIGLMAFDEAIEKYDSSKSRNFFKFAELVIKRRVIDYFKKTSSISKNEIPLSCFDSNIESEIEEKLSISDIGWETDGYEFIYELKDFSKQLETFGLNINNLPDYVPKHKDSRRMCVGIAKKIIENKNIYEKLKLKNISI